MVEAAGGAARGAREGGALAGKVQQAQAEAFQAEDEISEPGLHSCAVRRRQLEKLKKTNVSTSTPHLALRTSAQSMGSGWGAPRPCGLDRGERGLGPDRAPYSLQEDLPSASTVPTRPYGNSYQGLSENKEGPALTGVRRVRS